MQYIELHCKISPKEEYLTDLLSSQLIEFGYESFVESSEGIKAYIPKNLFDEKLLENLDFSFVEGFQISFEQQLLPDQNWNEEWEKNYFDPINIDNKCLIKSTFHKSTIKAEYEILIDPKMAFGTGHHQTTHLMIQHMLEMDFEGKKVLDMGCGTGVLAILAEMRGATDLLAIDIDEWAYTNTVENSFLNGVTKIRAMQGNAQLLGEERFDIVLANINRNILVEDIPAYAQVLKRDSTLLLSGFYAIDIPIIQEVCQRNELRYVKQLEKDNWVALRFEKE